MIETIKNLFRIPKGCVMQTNSDHKDRLDRASAELENETIGLRQDLLKLANSSPDPITALAMRMRVSRMAHR